VRKAAQNPELDTERGRGLVDILASYTQTFLLLHRYDEGLLKEPTARPGGRLPTVDDARAALAGLKADLMHRGQATELFARERDNGLDSITSSFGSSGSCGLKHSHQKQHLQEYPC